MLYSVLGRAFQILGFALTRSGLVSRFLAVTLLQGLSSQPVQASVRPVTVIIGGHAVRFAAAPVLGDDGQVSVPVEAINLLGAVFASNPSPFSLTVTAADGQISAIPCTQRQGHYFVPLQEIASKLGADAHWQPATRTLTMRAYLEMMRQTTHELLIRTSYPVTYQVHSQKAPNQISIDINGLDMDGATAMLPAPDKASALLRVHTDQIDLNTARLTLDLQPGTSFQVVSSAKTNCLRIAIDDTDSEILGLPPGAATPSLRSAPPNADANPANGNPAPTSPSQMPPFVPLPIRPGITVPSTTPSDSTSPDAAVGPLSRAVVRITGVQVNTMTETTTQIAVTTSGPTGYRTELLRDPNRLTFDLEGAVLDAGLDTALPGAGPIIKAVRAGVLHSGGVTIGRIVMDLTQLIGFTVATQHNDGGAITYLINLQISRHTTGSSGEVGGPGSLNGKIVVVDPGHGAQDSGAVAPDGSMEKSFTLAIGRKLRDALAANGATVFMTRSDDSFLSVMDRPQVAVTHHADYYISVHCDSSGQENSHSGTTVYFHAENRACRRLASDILNRVAEVSGLPAVGVRSDTIRFQGGFGVLRGSPMPAVLIECGYVNCASDLAKLKDAATQERVAQGIVAGLRDFNADCTSR